MRHRRSPAWPVNNNDLHPRVREIAVLQEATEMILASVDIDTVLHHILLIVRNYFGISNCAVFLKDASGTMLYCRAQNGYSDKITQDHRMRIGEQGVTGWVAHTRTPLYVPDVSKEPRYSMADPNVKSELALPLVIRDELVGVLDIESDKPAYFTEDMIGLLTLFAGQAAVALENARLYSTERRRMRQIELINLIARSATAASEIDQFLGTLAELIFDTFEGTDIYILLREPDGTLRLRARAGIQEHPAPDFADSQRAGIIAAALHARTNVLVNDVVLKAGHKSMAGAGCELGVPLVSFGETLGIIVVTHPKPNFFSSDDRSIAQAAADVCATAIKNVQLAEELRRVTSTDTLTGVFNQRYFHSIVAQEITRARRYNKRFALLLLDLRDFRQVNTMLGFDHGDEVLRQVAHLLRGHLRGIDTLCRYAADRFALLLPETDQERCETVQKKIEDALAHQQVELDGRARPLSASFASVHYPHDAHTELELVRVLLERLVEAKKRQAQSVRAGN
jgi:diguanylate cyclase (GGDEF)-like protein